LTAPTARAPQTRQNAAPGKQLLTVRRKRLYILLIQHHQPEDLVDPPPVLSARQAALPAALITVRHQGRCIMTEFNDLVAAQLSGLAYVPLEELSYLPKERLPEGWKSVPELSVYGGTADQIDRNNQMVTFVNTKERELVFAFEGSSNAQNLRSDLWDDGGSQWASLRPNVNLVWGLLTNENARSRSEFVAEVSPGNRASSSHSGSPVVESPVGYGGFTGSPVAENPEPREFSVPYKNYKMYGTGHSLGGGMAQTFLVEFELSGRVINSLPISPWAQRQTDYPVGGTFERALDHWKRNGHVVRATVVKRDIATWYYRYCRDGLYLDPEPLVLPPHEAGPSQTRDAQPHAPALTPEPPRWGVGSLVQGAFRRVESRNPLPSVRAHFAKTVIDALTDRPTRAESRRLSEAIGDAELMRQTAQPRRQMSLPAPVVPPKRRPAPPRSPTSLVPSPHIEGHRRPSRGW
jgi:hypothetical protein